MTTVAFIKLIGYDQGVLDISLVSFNKIEPHIIYYLKDNLEKIFDTVVKEGPSLDIPKSYDQKRKQYLSWPFLEALSKLKLASQCVLGVAEVDLFVPELNFIFGEAAPRFGIAVISLARLHQHFYGLPEDTSILKQRALKEAVHEIGHLLGLNHCKDPKCVMHFSNSLVDTDIKEHRFCSSCQKRYRY